MSKIKTKYVVGKETTNILCYGDSNTYGYNPNPYSYRYPYDKRWTSILQSKLGPDYVVSPEGLNGRTTAYDRPGAPWKNGKSGLIYSLVTHKPLDIVVLMLGTNDCLADLGLTADDIAAGMESLVEIVEKMTPETQTYVPEIIIVAPGAIRADFRGRPFEAELDDGSVRKAREIAPLYEKIAKKHGCRFIDATESAEVSEFDSMHLSEKGHMKLAELIYSEICELAK